ncbi:hypothetical protein SAMN02910298_02955 [Pseudobutyrivibrio sp. YE44]|nr:hypothetical protein [Pseudobutyrivibrio sp. YE44]SDB57365.1 hypothetical protein SAMN02910298_02955 [Pseudobutyrivibrio sp. YE44]
MEMITLKCPNCGKKFEISTEDARKKYQYGYVPIFCNIKCELRFSEKR